MLTHYLKTTLKQFSKSPSFSFINLFGLATAMAVCLMIFLYVYRELSFDRFHEQAENIYRISLHADMQGEELYENVSSPAMGPDLVEAFPEILDYARMSGRQTLSIWQENSFITVEKTHYADSTFFGFFSFELLRGNPHTALVEPYSVVVTETLAQKLFPDQDPMGKPIRLDDDTRKYTITGIAADCPPNSHIQFELLRSFETLIVNRQGVFTEWDANLSYHNYVKLLNDTDLDDLLKKTEELTYEKVNYKFEGMGVKITFGYFPLTDIRLRSPFGNELEEAGTLWKVWVFSLVALFVLFIAGFNYVNLTIARSGKRAKEVGMRKVLGAHKKALKKQFYLETLFLTGISFLGALILAEIFLPFFNQLLNTNLQLLNIPWWGLLLSVIIFVGVFGLLASIYPAWYMASFHPVKILKGEFWSKPGRFQPRNLLLLIQFAVSLALIVCTLVVFLQIRFFQQKEHGFNEKNLLVVRTESREDARIFMNAMESFAWIEKQSISTTFPGGPSYMEGIVAENVEPGFMAHRLWVDEHFMQTLELNLLEGRNFERADGLENENALVNQALVRQAGWTEPLGKTIERGGRTYSVIGVIEDYHFQSLHQEIEPLLVNTIDSRPDFMSTPYWVQVRYKETGSPDVLLSVQEKWEALFTGNTLRHYFISDHLHLQYATERSFGRLFLAFTLLAIIIAMLGVLGLSSFAAQQRQKETGIRKVMGASTSSILFRMSGEFLKWVMVGAIIALPLAYWYMDKWLSGFAYAIDFPYWTMLAALSGVLALALVIVTTQSMQSARANPADVLKTE